MENGVAVGETREMEQVAVEKQERQSEQQWEGQGTQSEQW